MIGQVINNYRILAKIGQGGMGEVYRAVDVNLDRPVAIKILSRDLSKDQSLIQRFQAEAKTQAQLNHPNICTLYSLFRFNEQLYMVMELVEGQNLEEMIQTRGPVPYPEAVPLFQQALFGLSQAHRSGIIHRDIKPSNFIVNRQGVTKVMDFGIARVMGQSRLTRTGMQVGTLYYMSPEQIQGKEVDFRSDIYALGITLFEMLTGTVPFPAQTDFDVMQAHVRNVPPNPSKVYPYLPKVFDKVILKALEKDPGRRYQTVEEFSQALGAAVQEALRTSPPPAVARPTQAYTAAGTAVPGTAGVAMSYTPGAPTAETVFLSTPAPRMFGMDRSRTILVLGIGGAVLFLLVAVVVTIMLFSKPEEPVTPPLAEGGGAPATSGGAAANLPAAGPDVFKDKGSSATPVDLSKLPGLAPKNQENPPAGKENAEPAPPDTPAAPGNQPAVRGGGRQNRAGPAKPPAPAPADPPIQLPGSPAGTPASPVAGLLEKAHQANLQKKYIEPPADNVIHYTAEALRLEPGNQYAKDLQSDAVSQVESQIQSSAQGGNLTTARRLGRLLLDYFPQHPQYQQLLQSLDQIEQQASALANARTFLVGHDHAGDFSTFCVGNLMILPDRVVFKTVQSMDRQQHDFEVARYEIKEFKKNRLPIGGYNCFHIKLRDGRNFNFAHINQQGMDLGPAAVVQAWEGSGR